MDVFEIRPLRGLAEMRQAEELQRLTWTMSEREIVPAYLMHQLQDSGAALLGAFDGGQLVGFVLGVLGTVEGLENRIDQVAAARLKMLSVIAGVLPSHQKQGLGQRLKLAQREFAVRIGVRLITWTFDPLESANAHLNINKLGAISHQYHRDFHGQLDGLSAGLPTDRLEVEWWVTGNRVKNRISRDRKTLGLGALISGGAVLVNEALFDGHDRPLPPTNFVSRPSNLMLVEIPAHFQQLREQSMELAARWREHTRDVLEGLFDSGFVVTDFVHDQDVDGRARSFYLLTYGAGRGLNT